MLRTGLIIICISIIPLSNARIIWKYSENGLPYLACNYEKTYYTLIRNDIPDNNFTVTLKLNECGISDLAIGCFDGCPVLDFLDISHNRIMTLKFGIFNRLSKLSKLDLSYNLITDLPGDVFHNMPILQELYLTGNPLINLNAEALIRVRSLWLSSNSFQGYNLNKKMFASKDLWNLYLDNNNMGGSPEEMFQNSPSLMWLSLKNCSLNAIPYISTPNLLDLYLDSNKIRYITNLDHLVYLFNLGLSNNQIDAIDDNAFVTMKNLAFLDLSGNRIQIISVNHFYGLSHLTRLDVSSNRISFLPSNFLRQINNFGVALRYFGFNKNPWYCACLRDLLQEAFSLDIAYDSERYDGSHILCVADVKFVCDRKKNFLSNFEQNTTQNLISSI